MATHLNWGSGCNPVHSYQSSQDPLLLGVNFIVCQFYSQFLKKDTVRLKKKKETVHQSDCVKIYVCSKNITNVLSIKVACGQIRVLMPSRILAVLELFSKQSTLQLSHVISTASEVFFLLRGATVGGRWVLHLEMVGRDQGWGGMAQSITFGVVPAVVYLRWGEQGRRGSLHLPTS